MTGFVLSAQLPGEHASAFSDRRRGPSARQRGSQRENAARPGARQPLAGMLIRRNPSGAFAQVRRTRSPQHVPKHQDARQLRAASHRRRDPGGGPPVRPQTQRHRSAGPRERGRVQPRRGGDRRGCASSDRRVGDERGASEPRGGSAQSAGAVAEAIWLSPNGRSRPAADHVGRVVVGRRERGVRLGLDVGRDGGLRSEEHTSELQSRRDLVCRLLLEKKKKNRFSLLHVKKKKKKKKKK